MKLVDETNKEKYTEFLEKHERCNFQQSLEWGKVKSAWKNEVVLAEDSKREYYWFSECFDKKNTYFW